MPVDVLERRRPAPRPLVRVGDLDPGGPQRGDLGVDIGGLQLEVPWARLDPGDLLVGQHHAGLRSLRRHHDEPPAFGRAAVDERFEPELADVEVPGAGVVGDRQGQELHVGDRHAADNT